LRIILGKVPKERYNSEECQPKGEFKKENTREYALDRIGIAWIIAHV
jgi:hypothetical protein